MRRQTSRDAKTQNTMAAIPNCGLKGTPEVYLPTATNHGYPGTGNDAGLKGETRHSHKMRPVHSTQ